MVEMFGGTDAGAVVVRGGYRATSAKLTNLRRKYVSGMPPGGAAFLIWCWRWWWRELVPAGTPPCNKLREDLHPHSVPVRCLMRRSFPA
jgi:hypothetical protein